MEFGESNMNFIRFFPILVAALGVIIHALGIVSVVPQTTIFLDITMFVVDFLVCYGLIKRKSWGYYLAIILFLQQSIMQPIWAYNKYVIKFFVIHKIEYFISPILVILSLIILVFNKNLFVKKG